MKKYLLVAFALVSLCVAVGVCQQRLTRFDALIQQETPLYKDIGVSVYEVDNSYIVLIANSRTIVRSVVFSAERVPINTDGLCLQKIDNIRDLLGRTLADVEKQFGATHVDTGSGFYIPSYVTCDGYLIKMWVEDNTIEHVSRIDLLTGDGTEWYGA